MSRKSIVGIMLVLIVVVASFVVFIYLRINPQKQIAPATLFSQLPNPQIATLFIREDTDLYMNLRGILTSKSIKNIQIAANNGRGVYTTYEISDKTRMICMDKKLENTWMDFHTLLDNHRALDLYPEKYVVRELQNLDTSGKQQVVFSKSKDSSRPDILWVIGCIS